MEYPTLSNVESLRQFMHEQNGLEVDNDQLFWFVCMYNAELISQSFSLKDTAAMLLEGIKPTNCLADVQAFIDTFFEDPIDDNYTKMQNLYIVKQVLEFYGKRDEAREVEALIEQIKL